MDHYSLSLTSFLAIYGALVATIVGAWNIYQQVTTYRGQLDVEVNKMDLEQGGVVIVKDRLMFRVTNVGRQPIWLQSIGGRYKRGSPHTHFMIATDKRADSPFESRLPVKLEPGEAFNDTSADVNTTHLERVRYLCAWDSKGKVYKAPRRQLRHRLLLKGRTQEVAVTVTQD